MIDVVRSAGNNHDMAHEREYAALGRLRWSQVRRFARIQHHVPEAQIAGDWNAVFRDLDWEYNQDYDPRWENYHSSGAQRQLMGYLSAAHIWSNPEWAPHRPPAGNTRRQTARDFMDRLTRENPVLEELLGWQGDFPLIGLCKEQHHSG